MAEVNKEDPTVMQGDPISTPIQPEPTTPPPAAAAEGNKEEYLYKGIAGNAKTPEELKEYAGRLEQLLLQNAATAAQQTAKPVVPQPMAPVQTPSNKAKFSELIYSNPDEAFELTVKEAQQRINDQLARQRGEETFMKDFYEQNEDLKGNERMVDYIIKANPELRDPIRFPTGKSVSDFLAKEARNMIEPVKKKYGTTETRLESKSAVAFGASGEPAPRVPGNTSQQEPTNFIDQVRRMGRHKK